MWPGAFIFGSLNRGARIKADLGVTKGLQLPDLSAAGFIPDYKNQMFPLADENGYRRPLSLATILVS